MVYLLYNPLSFGGHGELRKDAALEDLKHKYPDIKAIDFTRVSNTFFRDLNMEDILILVGGDGTINTYINRYMEYATSNQIYVYKGGSGNDFIRDIESRDKLTLLNPHLKNIPHLTVNGLKKYFINNVGFGIDGEVCVIADKLKRKGKKKINYSMIATKLLLLGGYKRRNGRVIVDGKEYTFKSIWVATVMNGRYYGGGMMCAPNQDRHSDKLSIVVIQGGSRFLTLLRFSKIFKGTHIKFKKMVHVYEGHDIEVFFDDSCGLQYDGEAVEKTYHYSAHK